MIPLKTMLLSAAGLSLVLSGAASAPADAQDPPLFPFVLPWNNQAPAGSITDLSALNAAKAGANGSIVVKNGHFVESTTGRRVRFLGINFFGLENSPLDNNFQGDADAIAAQLARQGYNLVRLMALDDSNPQDQPPSNTLFDPNGTDTNIVTLSPAQLSNLDYLIYALKQRGIYTDLILHGSRTFLTSNTPANMFPPDVDALHALAKSQYDLSFDDRVDEFDPAMIAADQKYASDLLTHFNSYTKATYAADPAIAIVEINNENSLTGGIYGTLGRGLESLPPFYESELVQDWNKWLSAKYGTDAALNTAWTAGLVTGPGLLGASSGWLVQGQPPPATAAITSAPINDGHTSLGAPGVAAATTAIDGTVWHAQAILQMVNSQQPLSLTSGSTYNVTFRAKSDHAQSVPFSAIDTQGYNSVGLTASVPLTTAWTPYSFVFTATGNSAQSRLSFDLGGSVGTVSIEDMQIHLGGAGAGLPAGQSLARGTVAIPSHALAVPERDWLSFLADTESGYARTMRTYLKSSAVGVKSNIICSQMGFGELTSLGREAPMEFADNHAYWDHPTYPLGALFGSAPVVTNRPLVNDLAASDIYEPLLNMAQYRVSGKPYSVSEYNHPWPNEFRAEALPELASFAAYQDWDIVTLFDEGGYGLGLQGNGTTSLIQGPFDCSEPAKAAFVPAAAMIFRAGEIPPAPGIAVVTVAPEQLVPEQLASTAWTAAATGSGTSLPSPFTQRLGLTLGKAGTPLSLKVTPPVVSPKVIAAALKVTQNANGSVYTASAPAAEALTGYVGGQTITLAGSTFAFPAFGVSPPTFSANFAAVTLIAMDQKPIRQSHRLLLTLVGKVENTHEVWNPAPVSAGTTTIPAHSFLTAATSAPVIAQGIPAAITLPTDDPKLHVWALDAGGKATAQAVTQTNTGGTLTFTVGGQYQTLWYELTDTP